MDLSGIHQQGGQGQRLAAGSGTIIKHLLARNHARSERGELGSDVLHLDPALAIGGNGLGGGRLAARIALRNPNTRADKSAFFGRFQFRAYFLESLVEIDLGFIHPEIHRRARREGPALIGCRFAEGPQQARFQPFRHVGADVQRRVGDVPRQPGPLRFGELFRGVVIALEQGVDGISVHPPDPADRPQRQGTGTVILHGEGRGGLMAQRVQHEAADPGAVARSGKTVRLAPIAHGILHRLVLAGQCVENLDGCSNAGAVSHGAESSFFPISWGSGPAQRAGSMGCRVNGE